MHVLASITLTKVVLDFLISKYICMSCDSPNLLQNIKMSAHFVASRLRVEDAGPIYDDGKLGSGGLGRSSASAICWYAKSEKNSDTNVKS